MDLIERTNRTEAEALMISTSPVLFVTVLGLTFFFFFWFFIHTIFKNKALIGQGDMIFPGDQLKIPTVGGKYQASVFENFFSPSLSSSPLLVIERSKTTSLSLSLLFVLVVWLWV